MRRIKVVFEEDPSLDCIEVTVRAPVRDRDAEEIISSLEKKDRRQLTVTDGNDQVRVLSPAEIFLISVNGKTLNIVTENERFSVRRSLQSIEESLEGEKFVRISRYELANLTKVKHYDFTLQGTLRLEFENGMEAWASRRCIPVIRKLLSGKG